MVNDCSTDRTAELVKSIAAKDSRVRLISNVKNSGVSYTRKHGLEEAKGSWISILDSDDAWAPEKLEKQIDLQRRTNADLLLQVLLLWIRRGIQLTGIFVLHQK